MQMSDHAISPPPSFTGFNISRPPNPSESSSTTPFSNHKSKRHSLNIVSPRAGSLPRPLHLSSGSVVTFSRSTSISPSPSPGPSLLDSATIASPSPLSPTISGRRRPTHARRQSSISYIPSSSRSAVFNKSDSAESLPRSPLRNGHVTPAFIEGLRLDLEGGHSRPVEGETSVSLDEKELRVFSPMSPRLKDRPPVTVAEKHAELLQFIAQKESKCLELRSQLAIHEAELLQLKRKWELIVTRGFAKSLSPTSTLSTSPPAPFPLSASLMSSSPSPSSSHLNSANYFQALSPTTSAPGTVVLEGIKEGVQGVGRLLAAGFESIANPSTNNEFKSPTIPRGPGPLRLVPLSGGRNRMNGKGHGQNESLSSSSTTASASTFSSVSSSGSPATSINESFLSNETVKNGGEFNTDDGKFGEFEGAQATKGQVSSDSGESEQVLMVRDTGATPVMSPNPDFQRKMQKVKDEVKKSDEAGGSAAKKDNEFDWDSESAWDEQMHVPVTVSVKVDNEEDEERLGELDGFRRSTMVSPKASASSHHKAQSARSSMNIVDTPTTQQVSSWVDSVGKRLGDIKVGNAFTKSQKRASLLFSDMQQGIVSVLGTPSGMNTPPLTSAFSSNVSLLNGLTQPPSPLSTTQPRAPTIAKTERRPLSLLDDSDDESFGEGNPTKVSVDDNNTIKLNLRQSLTPVMVPEQLSPNASAGAGQGRGQGGASPMLTTSTPTAIRPMSNLTLPNTSVSDSNSSETDDDWPWDW